MGLVVDFSKRLAYGLLLGAASGAIAGVSLGIVLGLVIGAILGLVLAIVLGLLGGLILSPIAGASPAFVNWVANMLIKARDAVSNLFNMVLGLLNGEGPKRE